MFPIKEINEFSKINTIRGTRITYKNLMDADDSNIVSELLLELICICNALACCTMNSDVFGEIVEYLEISPAKRKSLIENVTTNAGFYSVNNLAKLISGITEEDTINNKADENMLHYYSPIQPVFDIVSLAGIIFAIPRIVESLHYIDSKVIADYQADIITKKIQPEPYFTKDDGKIYILLKSFFNSDYPPKSDDLSIWKLAGIWNSTARQILWDKKKYHEADNLKSFGLELIEKDKVKESYETGETINTNGKKTGRNVLKEIAWLCVHNGLIAYFAKEEDVQKLIPNTKNPKRIKLWNEYVDSMYDVPETVKSLYRLDENGDAVFNSIDFKESKISCDPLICGIRKAVEITKETDNLTWNSVSENAIKSNLSFTSSEYQTVCDAADKGDAVAQYRMAAYYYTGFDEKKIIKRYWGEKYLEKAASSGLDVAQSAEQKIREFDINNRQNIEQIVADNIHSICKSSAVSVFMDSECKSDNKYLKRKKNALSAWIGVKSDSVIALADESITGNGKSGLMFTSDKICFDYAFEHYGINYDELDMIINKKDLCFKYGGKMLAISNILFDIEKLKHCLMEIKNTINYESCFAPLEAIKTNPIRMLDRYSDKEGILNKAEYDAILSVAAKNSSYSKEQYYFYLVVNRIVKDGYSIESYENDLKEFLKKE